MKGGCRSLVVNFEISENCKFCAFEQVQFLQARRIIPTHSFEYLLGASDSYNRRDGTAFKSPIIQIIRSASMEEIPVKSSNLQD